MKISLKINKNVSKENMANITISGNDTTTTYAYANAIRRFALEGVPYIAFGDLSFPTNTTIFNNEFIELRSRLVPLSLKTNMIYKDVDGKFIWKSGHEPEFSGKYISTHNKIYDFTANELYSNRVEYNNMILPDIISGDHHIVTKLEPNQMIHITAKVKIGTGLEHASFCPFGPITYRPDGKNKIKMTFDTNSQKPLAKQLIYDLLYWLKFAIIDFIQKIYSQKTLFSLYNTMVPTGVDIMINNENDTISSLIITEIRNMFDNGFSAYKIPHPLEKKVLFRLQPKKEIKNLKKWAQIQLQTAAQQVIHNLEKMMKKFKTIKSPTIENRMLHKHRTLGSIEEFDTEPETTINEIVVINNKTRSAFFHPDAKTLKLQSTSIAEFSVTLGNAKKVLEEILENIEDRQNINVFEGFACIGSDTSLLSKLFKNVISVELDNINYQVLMHNISVMKLQNVELIKGDTTKIIKEKLMETVDLVYYDPPWLNSDLDIKDYKKEENLRIKLGETSLEEMINIIPSHVKYILLKLPPNYDFDYIETTLDERFTHIPVRQPKSFVKFVLLKQQ
jgi:16S rRNA G966 N2-methylase RsmD/DNA-directed RNA polymerase subunit L